MELSRSIRNIAAVVAGLTLLQAALGALALFVPLAIVARDGGAAGAGLAAAGFSAGFLAGAALAVREVRALGHIRAMAAFGAIAAIAAAGFSFADPVWWWTVCMAVIGSSVAGLVLAGESWIADSAPASVRGAVVGAYLLISKAGLVAGPFLVAGAAPGDLSALILIIALFAACLLPVAATRRGAPRLDDRGGASLTEAWRTAPAAIAASLVAGAMAGAVNQLYPVFAADLDPDRDAGAAALFNAAMIGGAIVLQWPAGLISDHFDRRLVIAALTGAGAGLALALAFLGPVLPFMVTLGLAAAWGAGGLSFYGVAVAHAADRAGPAGAGPLMPALLIGWGVGSVAGPLLASALMSIMGSGGLFIFAGAALGALSAGLVWRSLGRKGVDSADKTDFAPLSETASAAATAAGHEPGQREAATNGPSTE